ncbi:MAG: hypothetical protein NVSMB27_41450 [Ktedonobacteraceae bacterium]
MLFAALSTFGVPKALVSDGGGIFYCRQAYDGSLKVEYQAVTLSKYTVELQDDHQHEQAVSTPRLQETPFRSPQLTLFDLGPHEWLLYWKASAYALRQKHSSGSNVTQLVLFEVPIQEKAAGAETAPPFLRLVKALQEHERE